MKLNNQTAGRDKIARYYHLSSYCFRAHSPRLKCANLQVTAVPEPLAVVQAAAEEQGHRCHPEPGVPAEYLPEA